MIFRNVEGVVSVANVNSSPVSSARVRHEHDAVRPDASHITQPHRNRFSNAFEHRLATAERDREDHESIFVDEMPIGETLNEPGAPVDE
jgi:hypothetical protein